MQNHYLKVREHGPTTAQQQVEWLRRSFLSHLNDPRGLDGFEAAIVVARAAGDAITLDVKALAGKTSWPVDNFRPGGPRHFLALVCFLDRIQDPAVVPEIYILPSTEVEGVTYRAPVPGAERCDERYGQNLPRS